MAFDVKRLDIYRKLPKDLTQPTLTGAIVSICCILFITFLLVSEFYAFISTEIESELLVESVEDNESDRIPVRLNITIPNLSCNAVGLDIQDDMGRHEVGFLENTTKQEINNGKGCLFEAFFRVNKVPGNFHVSTHSAAVQPDVLDMAHIINSLKFGDDMSELDIGQHEKGGFDSLAGKDKSNVQAVESHEYHMKIVPTRYEDHVYSDVSRSSYQYTYAYKKFVAFSHSGRIMPAIWFRYDMTPITVKYRRKRKPLYSFLTTVAAIVGGVFTVAGIIDSLIFSASNLIKKLELGKLS